MADQQHTSIRTIADKVNYYAPYAQREGGTYKGGRSSLQVAWVPRQSGQDKSWVALRQGMGVGVVNENPPWSLVSADGGIHTILSRPVLHGPRHQQEPVLPLAAHRGRLLAVMPKPPAGRPGKNLYGSALPLTHIGSGRPVGGVHIPAGKDATGQALRA